MARPKKTVRYDADDDTIREYFRLSVEAKGKQKTASAEISALNSQMEDDGVDPGTLSTCRKLAAMKPGKRGSPSPCCTVPRRAGV